MQRLEVSGAVRREKVNTVIYVFLLLCLCILIVCLCTLIVPAGTLRLL